MSFTAELTLKDRATMAMRATYLITIFLPFIFLGPLLLFLADLLLKWSQDSKVQVNGHRYPLLSQALCSSLHNSHVFKQALLRLSLAYLSMPRLLRCKHCKLHPGC